MTERNSNILTWTIVLIVVFLAGCSPRGAVILNGGNSTTPVTDGTACKISLAASAIILNSPSSILRVGDAVAYEVLATGCSGSYKALRLDAPSVIYSFNAAQPAYFNVAYSAPKTNFYERIEVRSIDNTGAILSSIVVNAPTINVQAALTCVATVSTSQMNIPVNSQGTPLQAINFQFEVTTSTPARLIQVSSGGTNLSMSVLPTPQGKSHVIQIPVNTVGTKNFTFKVRDTASNSENTCSRSVTTVAQNPTVPTNPAPTNPAPTNPAPTNPAPTNPAPTNPTPANPTPTIPAPTNPTPINPTPTNPTPTNPTPTNPTPMNPTPPLLPTPPPVPVPVITNFNIIPPSGPVGTNFLVQIDFVGQVSNAKIGNIAVGVSNNHAERSFTVSQTGRPEITGVLTGPGGTNSQTGSFSVNPICTITPLLNSRNVGQTFPFRIMIRGNFLNANVIGLGLQPYFLNGSSQGLLNLDFATPVVEAQGPQQVTLNVIGPDGTSTSCQAAITTVNVAPVMNIKVLNTPVTTPSFPVPILSTPLIAWTTTDATNCSDAVGQSLPTTGSVTLAAITGDSSFTLRCQGLDGASYQKTVGLPVTARWFTDVMRSCPQACAERGLTNIEDRDGYKCASGERRPRSLAEQVYQRPPYYECENNNCAAQGPNRTYSVGGYCYDANQKRDDDGSDRTIACYCR